ncbi:MAG: hypothetical protein ACM3NO_01750 [Deltaproteobacteria bacterium]
MVLGADSRTYAFHVIDSPAKTREFKVCVQAQTFGPSLLKIQDGPGISMARLKRELALETPESPALASLRLAESDIREYLEKTYPKPVKRWGVGSQS